MALRVRYATDADWEAITALRNRARNSPMVCRAGMQETTLETLRRKLSSSEYRVRVVEDMTRAGVRLLGFMAGHRRMNSDPPRSEIVYWVMDYDYSNKTKLGQASALLARVSAEQALADGVQVAHGVIDAEKPQALAAMKEHWADPRQTSHGVDPVTREPHAYKLELEIDEFVRRRGG